MKTAGERRYDKRSKSSTPFCLQFLVLKRRCRSSGCPWPWSEDWAKMVGQYLTRFVTEEIW